MVLFDPLQRFAGSNLASGLNTATYIASIRNRMQKVFNRDETANRIQKQPHGFGFDVFRSSG